MNNIIIDLQEQYMYQSFPQTVFANYYYFSGNIQYYSPFSHVYWAETQQNINPYQKNVITNKKEAQNPCGIIESDETIWEKYQTSKNCQNQKRKNNRREKRSKGKQLESSKKNSESNIVNHILCFLGRQNQSEQILTKIFQSNNHLSTYSSELKKCFYSALKLINLRRGRRYVNIQTLLKLFRSEDIIQQIPQISEIMPLGCQIEDLCYLFRVCVFYFLRKKSDVTILASRRMSYDGKKIHLGKLRTIVERIIRRGFVEDNQEESE